MRLLYDLDPAKHAQFEEANKASQRQEPSLLENEVPENFVV